MSLDASMVRHCICVPLAWMSVTDNLKPEQKAALAEIRHGGSGEIDDAAVFAGLATIALATALDGGTFGHATLSAAFRATCDARAVNAFGRPFPVELWHQNWLKWDAGTLVQNAIEA